MILEPLPANFGLLVQRPEWLKLVVETAHRHGALVIFDEVISGFRVALGGMAERLKMKPDLVTFGKVLGGGFPVGAYAGKSELMSMVSPDGPVYQAGTLSANPIGMQVGLATMEKTVSAGIYEGLEARTTEFVSQIRKGFENHDLPFDISGYASIFWIHGRTVQPIRSIGQIPKEHAARFQKLFHECLKREIYLAPSGYEVGFVSWAHSEQLLKECAGRIVEATVAAVSV